MYFSLKPIVVFKRICSEGCSSEEECEKINDKQKIPGSYLRPGANIIKLFGPWFTDFCTELECLSLLSFSSLVEQAL